MEGNNLTDLLGEFSEDTKAIAREIVTSTYITVEEKRQCILDMLSELERLQHLLEKPQ